MAKNIEKDNREKSTAKKRTRIICVAGAKGGTGKTTTVINLGAAINFFNCTSTIIDTNLITPDVGIYLGVPIPPATLHDVLKGKSDSVEAVYTHPSGMKVMPASIAFQDTKKIKYPQVGNVITDLTGLTDFIILDCPPSLGKETVSILSVADEVLIVTTPEMPSVTDALKTVKLCQELGKDILGVLVTKTNVKNVDMSIKDIEAILDIPVIGFIPEDRDVKFAQIQKDAVVHTHPKSAAAVQYKRLAADLLNIHYTEKLPEDSLITWILKWIGARE